MSRQQSATLPHCDTKRGGGDDKTTEVITIRIYKRKGSKYWQALVHCGKWRKKITTGTVIKPAAQEFAVLAFKHFARLKDANRLPEPTRRESESC